ncbi:MAG TPA: hypothetical protein VF808_15450 [Ktedonobacterales bacterium]
MNEDDRYEERATNRRETLGAEYVERALPNRTRFNEVFQRFITRHGRSKTWPDATSPRHTRNFVTVALLAGRHIDELPLRLEAALRNNVLQAEIKALLPSLGDILRCPGGQRRVPPR